MLRVWKQGKKRGTLVEGVTVRDASAILAADATAHCVQVLDADNNVTRTVDRGSMSRAIVTAPAWEKRQAERTVANQEALEANNAAAAAAQKARDEAAAAALKAEKAEAAKRRPSRGKSTATANSRAKKRATPRG